MVVPVVAKAAGHHGDVRFGLGLVVECQRALPPDLPPWPERGTQRFLDRAEGGKVTTALRLGDDQLPAEQLHPAVS
jgi:hypothetical protein